MSSLFTMPMIVMNMGGEMVYILNQRLQAQSVQDDKAVKVLQDVLKAMFSKLFIEELFKPQEMYSAASTKQIFEKLAHSSIMRLNKSSMDKLYDLMTMGFKRQIIICNCPKQYLVVTLNHLESLKQLIQDTTVKDMVQVAIDKTLSTYSTLTDGQWTMIKYSLLCFLQDQKIKVSLFLQQNLQTMDGVLIVSNEGNLPYGIEIPGTIRYYEGGTVQCTSTFELNSESNFVELNHNVDFTSKNGLNMYSKDAISFSADAKNGTILAESFQTAQRLMNNVTISSGGAKSTSRYDQTRVNSSSLKSSAKAELTLLSDLLGMAKDDHDSKPFKINLFPNHGGNSKESAGSDEAGNYIHFDIDASADAKSVERYMMELDLEDSKAGSKYDEDEDDLLALMDDSK